MEEYFPKFAGIFIAFEIIVLIASLVSMFLFGHKRIDRYLQMSDDRLAKVIRAAEKLCKLYRLMLWFSPIYLVFVPLAIYYFLPEWTVYYVIIDLLLFVAVAEVYFYEKWILKQIKPRAQQA
jgi:hypothetical protein